MFILAIMLLVLGCVKDKDGPLAQQDPEPQPLDHEVYDLTPCYTLITPFRTSSGTTTPFGLISAAQCTVLASSDSLEIIAATGAYWWIDSMAVKVAGTASALCTTPETMIVYAQAVQNARYFQQRQVGMVAYMTVKLWVRRLNLFGTQIMWRGPLFAWNEVAVSGCSPSRLRLNLSGCGGTSTPVGNSTQ